MKELRSDLIEAILARYTRATDSSDRMSADINIATSRYLRWKSAYIRALSSEFSEALS
jgi:hypothetical protein